MSVSFRVGFAGVSMKTSLVFGRIACATALGSEVSTKLASTSKICQDLLKQPDRSAVNDIGDDDVIA